MTEAVLSRSVAGFKRLLPAKGKAVAIHLSISFAIFLVLLYLILFRWYPQPYFATDGGWQGIRIAFGVDMVIGPLLTFVVFNPTKPRREIVMDLSLVAALQLSALAWGVQTIHAERPVAILEFAGTFGSVTEAPLRERNIDLATLKQYDDRRPPVIFQREPQGEEVGRSSRLANTGEWQRRAQTFLYARFDQNLHKVMEHAAAYERKTATKSPDLLPRFEAMRKKHGSDVVFLPFDGRYGEAVLVISPGGEILDSIAP